MPGNGSDDTIDPARRGMLLRLGLAATAAYVAPMLMRLSGARASSGSGPSASGSRSRTRRPEIVVAAPNAADIDRIAAQGYILLSRDRLALVDAEIARFRVPARLTIEQARTQIMRLVPAALFDINHVYRPGELACGADSCAAFEMIGWKAAAHACPAGTTIGMIDTSVNVKHEALAGVDIEAFDVLAEGRRPASNAHGTAIAVLLAGRRDARTPGLLDGLRVIAAQAFHRDARGQDAADAFDIARAIDRLAARKAGVINMSFAGPANAVLERVVTVARGRDVVLVAAAGNSGPRSAPLYPAAYENVVAVTAIDRNSQVYRQASTGAHIDFAAPGVRLWTAASVSGGRYRSGTSYAAPFVSAAFAVARARAPQKSAAELIDELAKQTVDLGPPGRDATYGWGLVQSDGDCAGRGAGFLAPAQVPTGG
ncbi:MAG: S8 family serine peptidase [Xanthobacteraceae bacterium]